MAIDACELNYLRPSFLLSSKFIVVDIDTKLQTLIFAESYKFFDGPPLGKKSNHIETLRCETSQHLVI